MLQNVQRPNWHVALREAQPPSRATCNPLRDTSFVAVQTVPGLKFKVKKSVNLLFGTVTPTALIAVCLIILPARTNFLPNDEEFLFVSKKKREKEREQQLSCCGKQRSRNTSRLHVQNPTGICWLITVLGDGRGSFMDGDYGVIAMIIMMTVVSHTLNKPSEVGHAKLIFGHSTDLRHWCRTFRHLPTILHYYCSASVVPVSADVTTAAAIIAWTCS